MKISNKDINQKFLLALINTTDSVYSGGLDEGFYFYPKDLGFTIQIPFSHHSTSVDVNFVFEKYGSRDSDKEVVNFSFPFIDDISQFMNQVYQKHETMLNNHGILPEAIKKCNEALTEPLGPINPYKIIGKHEDTKLFQKTDEYELNITLGKSLYNFESPKKTKPLEPIIIDCFYKPTASNKNEYYKKVIPAYKVDEYPIVAKLANINPTVNDVHALSDALSKINPKAGALLSSMILDVELDKKEVVKNNRPKL